MSEFVKVTKKELEERFLLYNDLYFDGQLEKPYRFELWTHQVKCVGWVRGYWTSTNKFRTFFHINSKCYNWPDEYLKRVIIHEMIHLAIKDYQQPVRWWHWLFPPKQHDREYVDYMNHLNEKYGLEVTVRAKYMRPYRK